MIREEHDKLEEKYDEEKGILKMKVFSLEQKIKESEVKSKIKNKE
jgi:hypothetical protein